MAKSNVQKTDFPTYFLTKEDENGHIEVIHICNDLAAAQRWRDAKQKTDEDKDNEDAGAVEDETQVETSDDEGDEEENDFASLLAKLIFSMKSFYDLIAINASVKVLFPNLFLDRQLVPFKDHLDLIDSEGAIKLFGVPENQVAALNSKTRQIERIEDGISSIPSNVIMGLVARFDANISGLVRYLLTIRKERLAGSDKTVLVKDILSAKSFEDLITDLVDDEIHSLMRGSHEEQVKYIEDNFAIDIRTGFERWPQFIEVFERRNLAAHGEGLANARYNRICTSIKVPEEARLPVGAKLDLSDAYLRRATDVLLEFGTLLIWWLWLKQEPNQAERAYLEINSATFELITEKRYRLASRILQSALSRKTKGAPESAKRMMTVNLANCYKKLNEDKECAKTLDTFDWTASSDEFKISVASLRDDVDLVVSLMHRVTDDNVVGKQGIRDWPVFDWVRSDDRVKAKFKEVFGEPLEIAVEKKKITKRERASNELSEEPSKLH